jgi:hypothetical protein
MTLFQLLILGEQWRQFLRDMDRALRIKWFVNPPVERSFMRRIPGVMTVKNDPSRWRGIIK